jgi:predicted proteasome-type protease
VWLPPELADPVRKHYTAHGQKEKLSTVWRLHMVQLIYLLSDVKFWTITAQTVVNVLALLIKHEGAKLLLVVHMLEIFSHSVVLQNVMRSITYRGNTLLQTAGLALVMIYFFGVIGFMQFPELFQVYYFPYFTCSTCFTLLLYFLYFLYLFYLMYLLG